MYVKQNIGGIGKNLEKNDDLKEKVSIGNSAYCK